MTAKELKDKARREVHPHHTYIEKYVFSREEMAIFWSQLCEEQRKICSNTDRRKHMAYHKMAEWAIKDNIRNAPEPEFE